ncbi:hypothetical protein Q4O60_18985, partial [Aeribacillus pallidus]|nr:hypothetical protein [Aeribacillus pallidus]
VNGYYPLGPLVKTLAMRGFFLYLPPYSPQLTPIERLRKWRKDPVMANVFHKERNDIMQAFDRWLISMNIRRRCCSAWGMGRDEKSTLHVACIYIKGNYSATS